MEQPLNGLRVLDLGAHVTGPYAAKLLADYGADVVKIERPGTGDPSRGYGPFPCDIPHPERSGTFLHLNTNTRGITLNFQTQPGPAILRELARTAHVLLESSAPGVMQRLGVD